MMRFERLGVEGVCAECGDCTSHKTCDEVRTALPGYGGIRFTSDGFDCALPVAIDSHSVCAYGCLYCFSDNLVAHRGQRTKSLGVGQTSLKRVEKLFAGETKGLEVFRKALKYDRKVNGYPCPIQLGALNDPADYIEAQQGWLLGFMELAIKYRQPIRISTKGRLLKLREYLSVMEKAPELFWVAFSIITPDDEVIRKVDRRAPDATARLETMRALSGIGVRTALRIRPILPGISDRTPGHPEAYKELIQKAAHAGAGAISCEVAFVSGAMPAEIRQRWERLSAIAGVPFERVYKQFGPYQACMRPPYTWTENIMHAIAEEGHKCGMVLGVSDPVWKQLGDTGCCCGMLPDDPVFGNWQRESATNQLLEAKRTGKELSANDVIPAWAYEVPVVRLCAGSAGPLEVYQVRHRMWADKLRATWNNLSAARGPLQYFQGALVPVRREGSEVIYRYQGLQRSYPKNVPFWSSALQFCSPNNSIGAEGGQM